MRDSTRTLILTWSIISLCLSRGRAQLNAPGGTYAGYRMRQNCDPAGGTVENQRLKATMNFALCCEGVGTGENCCNSCLEQFALYFDYSFPCWSKQGGEVMQLKTEDQMEKNFFKWDTAYYRWRCAGSLAELHRLALGLVAAITVFMAIC